jgi:hypothetical protein
MLNILILPFAVGQRCALYLNPLILIFRSITNKLLRLNSSKSLTLLNWRAKLNFDETIFYTISWYKEFFNNSKNLKDHLLNSVTHGITNAKQIIK